MPATAADRPTDLDLPATAHKREAEEWAFVLQAIGIEASLLRRDDALYSVAVATADRERAAASLAAWQLERSAPPLPAEPAAVFTFPTRAESILAVAAAGSLVAFHVGLVRAGRWRDFVERGESQAALVQVGELDRTLTALTLHADLEHAVGNALIGAFFLAAVAGRLGLGVAIAAFLATGALGNLADAVYYQSGHSTIGASTGVFGLVGVLTGLAAWRRHERVARRRGAWVALGAGLALVAMLGGAGPDVALAAHLFGLAAGTLAGIGIAYPLARRPRPNGRAQLVAFVGAVAAIAWAWGRASAT